jgi:hypothetical protein
VVVVVVPADELELWEWPLECEFPLSGSTYCELPAELEFPPP